MSEKEICNDFEVVGEVKSEVEEVSDRKSAERILKIIAEAKLGEKDQKFLKKFMGLPPLEMLGVMKLCGIQYTETDEEGKVNLRKTEDLMADFLTTYKKLNRDMKRRLMNFVK